MGKRGTQAEGENVRKKWKGGSGKVPSFQGHQFAYSPGFKSSLPYVYISFSCQSHSFFPEDGEIAGCPELLEHL
jgi:hypothetical protein